MPWCEDCAKYMTPSALKTDGSCPTCGRRVAEEVASRDAEEERAPWHFKLMVVALIVYLVWRFADMFM